MSAAAPATAPAPVAAGKGLGRIQVGTAVTLGPTGSTRILRLAAAAAEPGSLDPVDVALQAEATSRLDGKPGTAREVESFDHATAERPYSVTVVNEPDGKRYAILRGELGAVISAAHIGPDKRLQMRNNERWVQRRGYRALAVATAGVDANGSLVKPFEVHGFVPVRTARAKGFKADVVSRDAEYVRVPLWPATLRWLHWLNVLLIVVLTLSGYMIATPYLHSGQLGETDAGFFMGWVRYVHFVSAFAWLMLAVVRVYLGIFSRNRWVRWPVLWPFKSKEDIKELGRTISAYALIRPEHVPTYIAHNPMQQLAYTGIYVMAGVQALTGLALYGLYNNHVWFWSILQFPVEWVGAPTVRLIHFLIMWAFWVFLVLHIYLAVRADSLERHGGLSSMISGGIYLRRGTKAVDDPDA